MTEDKEEPRRGPAASPRSTTAAAGTGQIVFRCPNGHRIVAPAALAGKRGKCSKCEVDVGIPDLGGAAAASPAGEPPQQPPTPPAAREPQPGPAAFPASDSEASPLPPSPVSEGGPNADDESNWSFIGVEPAAGEGNSSGDWLPAAGLGADSAGTVARLVARLWAEREHGGVIELHLEGGSVLLPAWYDARWSRGTHGLFASQGADGTVTLTAVAWDTVRKVVVRQLAGLPDDMFT